MDGDYLVSNYGTIEVKNPGAYKDTAGWYEISNEGINSHYITHHIADSSVIKSIKRPNILKR